MLVEIDENVNWKVDVVEETFDTTKTQDVAKTQNYLNETESF